MLEARKKQLRKENEQNEAKKIYDDRQVQLITFMENATKWNCVPIPSLEFYNDLKKHEILVLRKRPKLMVKSIKSLINLGIPQFFVSCESEFKDLLWDHIVTLYQAAKTLHQQDDQVPTIVPSTTKPQIIPDACNSAALAEILQCVPPSLLSKFNEMESEEDMKKIKPRDLTDLMASISTCFQSKSPAQMSATLMDLVQLQNSMR